MASVRTLSACQIIRPLLSFPKSRLVATLRNKGIAWIEDPSNIDPRYARTNIRRNLASASTDTLAILKGAKRFERARHALEAHVSEWFARHADLRAEGYLQFDMEDLCKANSEIRLRILARAAMAIGGKTYPPSIAAVERLDKSMAERTNATPGGARFVIAGHMMTVCREARNLPDETPLTDCPVLWDRRFLISAMKGVPGQCVRPWSSEMARLIPRDMRPAWFHAMPDCSRNGFPVIRSNGDFKLVKPGCIGNKEIFVQFTPKIPLSGGGFSVA